MLHPLDLPNLNREPPSTEIWAVLDRLKVSSRNFESLPPLEPHILNWLSKLVCCDLNWLDPDDSNQILEFASQRISQSCGIASRSNSVRTLDVGNLEFRLHEPGLTNDNIGHKTWGSCLVLANRLIQHPQLLNGRVIELGSGTGLCGMVCAHLGHETLLTDLEQIVENIRRNIDENRSLFSVGCSAAVLDWSQPSKPESEYETVVISDPVYSPAAPKQISQTLKLLAVPKLLLQLPQRLKFEDLRQNLYDEIKGCGYICKETIEEDGMDDFGPSGYVFTRWELQL